MPEATSNSTVTIPGGISTNDILDSLSASELLSALTGGTVTAGDGSAINNNTYYQPVDISQNFGGRSVTSLSGGADRLQAPDLMPLQPMAAMPQMPALQRANTVGIQDVGRYIAGMSGGISGGRDADAGLVAIPASAAQHDYTIAAKPQRFVDKMMGVKPQTPQEMQADIEAFYRKEGLPVPPAPVLDAQPQPLQSYADPVKLQQQAIRQPVSSMGPADIAAIKQQGIDEFLKKQSESPAGPLGQYFTPEALERQQSYERMLPQAVALAQNNKKPVSRFLERMAGGLNQNIAARQAAEATGKWNLIKEAVNQDSAMARQIHGDIKDLQKTAMNNDVKMKIASAEAKAKGALTHSQAHTMARESLKNLDPRSPMEAELLKDTLVQAEAVTGFPYTKYLGMRTKEGAVEAMANQAKATKAVIDAGDAALKAANTPKDIANKNRQADATFDATVANTNKAQSQIINNLDNHALQPGRVKLQQQNMAANDARLPGIQANSLEAQYAAFLKGNAANRVGTTNQLEDNQLALSNNAVGNIPLDNMTKSAQALTATANSLVAGNTVDSKIKSANNAASASDQRLILNNQQIAQNRGAAAKAALQKAISLQTLLVNGRGSFDENQKAAIQGQINNLIAEAYSSDRQVKNQSQPVANAFDLRAATVDTQAASRTLGTNTSQNYRAPESANQIMDNRLRREDDALARGGNTLRISKAPVTDYEMIGDEAARKDQALAKIDEWRYSAPSKQAIADQRTFDAAIRKDNAINKIDQWRYSAPDRNELQRQAAINLNERGLKFKDAVQAKAAIKAEAKRLQAQAQKPSRGKRTAADYNPYGPMWDLPRTGVVRF